MMAAAMTQPALIARLPAVRGRYRENADLARITWFRVGGPAEIMFRPADTEDLAAFLRACPADVPVTVIGVGSNVLVRDGGVPGVVIRLGRAFATMTAEGTEMIVGAGALDGNVARAAAEAGIAGLEFLAGIPGTIGGALRMNGGAYGREMKDVLVSAQAVSADGNVLNLSAADMGFSYRHSDVPGDVIFTGARLRGEPGARDEITARITEIQDARAATQPIRTRTGGSTFKNPPGHKAWELIDGAGCRGLTHGDAQISEQHCNFLINRGAATAADIEALGKDVRRRVKAASGITLEWEIRIIGVPSSDGEQS
jgi:UDP-N-acetylmuramate dehydrogenase